MAVLRKAFISSMSKLGPTSKSRTGLVIVLEISDRQLEHQTLDQIASSVRRLTEYAIVARKTELMERNSNG